MSFDNYANFRTEVNLWLTNGSGDVTTTSLDSYIRMGENYVNRKLRIQDMETALAVTINAAGVATLPTDYVEAQYLYLNRSPFVALTKRSAEWIFRNYPDRSATGVPESVAESAGTFIFGPVSDAANTVQGTYYARPASMPGNSTINAVFSAFPEIYLWAALAQAETHLGRDQRLIWQQKADEAIERANQEDKRKKFSGSPLAAVPG